MSETYEFYQGLVLRQLVVQSKYSVVVRPFLREGRINAFVVNGVVGVFIKHSGKRMRPWPFTFNLPQVADLLDLESRYFDSFFVCVCGEDGMVTLNMESLHQIVGFGETESAWIRVDRSPRAQYAVSGNRAELPHKIANGIGPILQTLEARGQRRTLP
jgi:hypothetical protein